VERSVSIKWRVASSNSRVFVRAAGIDFAWGVIPDVKEVEVGNAGEQILPLTADISLMSLKTRLMSQGSLKVVFVCLTGQCRNKILVTGYRP
jgi:hypothetical protein